MVFEMHKLAVKVVCGAMIAALYCIEPFLKIRFGRLRSARLGHLAMNTDVVLRRWQIYGKPQRTTFLFVTSGGAAANSFLVEMFRRILPVLPENKISVAIRRMLQLFKNSRFELDMAITSTEYREYALGVATLRMTDAEKSRGEQELNALGIPPGKPIVCFANRDEAYLKHIAPNENRSYHDFRNSSIANYIPAMRVAIDRGYVAVRMGSIVEQPLQDVGPGIIDYATTGRSEFLDVYLAQRCKFLVGTGNGTAQLPLIFDTPYIATNLIPLFLMYFGKQTLFMPKLIKSASDGSFLPFSALQAMGAFDDINQVGLDGDWYKKRGLVPIENDAGDIAAACSDMFNILDGKPTPQDTVLLQRSYKDRYFFANSDRHYAATIAPSFIKRWQGVLLA
jgi:putative glycosyltransferase (TIGR04372 family)